MDFSAGVQKRGWDSCALLRAERVDVWGQGFQLAVVPVSLRGDLTAEKGPYIVPQRVGMAGR